MSCGKSLLLKTSPVGCIGIYLSIIFKGDFRTTRSLGYMQNIVRGCWMRIEQNQDRRPGGWGDEDDKQTLQLK